MRAGPLNCNGMGSKASDETVNTYNCCHIILLAQMLLVMLLAAAAPVILVVGESGGILTRRCFDVTHLYEERERFCIANRIHFVVLI
jgi:hypothetical protein